MLDTRGSEFDGEGALPMDRVGALRLRPSGRTDHPDRGAPRVSRHELRGARPNYGWLGEETGAEEGEDPTRPLALCGDYNIAPTDPVPAVVRDIGHRLRGYPGLYAIDEAVRFILDL